MQTVDNMHAHIATANYVSHDENSSALWCERFVQVLMLT